MNDENITFVLNNGDLINLGNVNGNFNNGLLSGKFKSIIDLINFFKYERENFKVIYDNSLIGETRSEDINIYIDYYGSYYIKFVVKN